MGLEVWRFDYMMLRRLDATSATESFWAFRSRNHWSSLNYLWVWGVKWLTIKGKNLNLRYQRDWLGFVSFYNERNVKRSFHKLVFLARKISRAFQLHKYVINSRRSPLFGLRAWFLPAPIIVISKLSLVFRLVLTFFEEKRAETVKWYDVGFTLD